MVMLNFLALLGFLMSDVLTVDVTAKKAAVTAVVPDRFDHSDQVDTTKAALGVSYNDSTVTYKFDFDTDVNWTLTTGDNETVLEGSGTVNVDGGIDTLRVESDALLGTRCLFFSVYTTTHDISWSISVNNHHTETITPLPANRQLAKKITVGLSNKPYTVGFHLYGFNKHARPTFGKAYIGKLALVNGPCPEDLLSLDCTFDNNFCNWINAGSKYMWYHVPFGLHSHTIKFGALAAFAGKGALFSPVVQPDDSKCFSFNYAKGEGRKSYLRVWLIYRIPFSKDVKALLYEDVSKRIFLKKQLHINIFIPYDYQIAFEGRSETILHGVVVLHTSITDHRCPGTGAYMNLKPDLPDLPTAKDFTASTRLPVMKSTKGVS